jgi:hypothetical protein
MTSRFRQLSLRKRTHFTMRMVNIILVIVLVAFVLR